MQIVKSIPIFILAGLCEIGGGYLIWLWLKEEKPIWYGLIGGFILVLYGVVATLQTQNFARVYATYGGIFIVMSLLWSMKFPTAVMGLRSFKWKTTDVRSKTGYNCFDL